MVRCEALSLLALAADWGLLTNCLEKQVVASVAGRRQLQLCPAPAPQPVSAYTAAAASLYTTARGNLEADNQPGREDHIKSDISK